MCSVADELYGYSRRHNMKADVPNALGCETSTAYRKLNPNDKHCGLHAIEISNLCNGLRDYRLLHAIAAACGHACFQLKPNGTINLPSFTKELGEALSAVSKAMADGTVDTKQEARECLPELMDLIQVATSLLRQCQDILKD